MVRVYLALGSNVGDSVSYIQKAQKSLMRKVDCCVSAPLYRTKPVGYTKQEDFVNTVICGETDLSPVDLLKFVKSVEQKVGRTKSFRWGPREIDIDIILYDDLVMQSEELTIPHPEFTNRDFVLKPLLDLNPKAVDPKTGVALSEYLKSTQASNKSIV